MTERKAKYVKIDQIKFYEPYRISLSGTGVYVSLEMDADLWRKLKGCIEEG